MAAIGLPAQMQQRSASELAAIARTATEEHSKQCAIRELELRAERSATQRVELTAEAEQVLAEMRELAEQVGGSVAAGLADIEDDDACLAELFTRFDTLVLSWVIAS